MAEDKKNCPICGGTFWVETEKGVVRCKCYKEYLKRRRFEEAEIPKAFKNKKLGTYKPLSDSQGKALLITKKFVDEFKSGVTDRGLLFTGNVGVGKTHLAVAILNDLIEAGYRGLFINFIHLIEKIKQSYGNNQTFFSEPEIFEKIKKSHIVVVDELGAATPTEFVFNKMYDIINYCFSEGISIIFTTNYPLNERKKRDLTDTQLDSINYILKSTSYSLEERISERLVSRILGKCKVVKIVGEDFRRKNFVY